MPINEKLEWAHDRLRAAAARLDAVRRPGWGDTASRLDVELQADGIRVHWLLNEDADFFLPEGGETIFEEIYGLLGSRRIAPWLTSLELEGHRIAANGFISWEIRPIAFAKQRFARLEVFRLESITDEFGEPHFAGELAIGPPWDDTSAATRLLNRMPGLRELAIPEPPREEAFFEGRAHPLRKLSVYDVDAESFVERLARSKRFPQLEELAICESFQTDVNPRLPASDYATLLQSEAFPALRSVSLGEVDLDADQVNRLRGTTVGRQLCRFEVGVVRSWCDQPIQRAPASDRAEIGEPAEPPTVEATWLTRTARGLAETIRDTGDWSAMPVLGDALEEAGCDRADLLAHCRGPGPHVAGCWVVDLLTGSRAG